jgi:multisubunit Na+/H+ antiporter MnhC subunit
VLAIKHPVLSVPLAMHVPQLSRTSSHLAPLALTLLQATNHVPLVQLAQLVRLQPPLQSPVAQATTAAVSKRLVLSVLSARIVTSLTSPPLPVPLVITALVVPRTALCVALVTCVAQDITAIQPQPLPCALWAGTATQHTLTPSALLALTEWSLEVKA